MFFFFLFVSTTDLTDELSVFTPYLMLAEIKPRVHTLYQIYPFAFHIRSFMDLPTLLWEASRRYWYSVVIRVGCLGNKTAWLLTEERGKWFQTSAADGSLLVLRMLRGSLERIWSLVFFCLKDAAAACRLWFSKRVCGAMFSGNLLQSPCSHL